MALPAAVFVASVAWVGQWRQIALQAGQIDVPNPRSSHTAPTPRGGGLGMILAALAGGVVLLGYQRTGLLMIVVGAVAVNALLGWWEDRRTLPVGLRLGLQAVVALAAVWWVGPVYGASAEGILANSLAWLASILALMWLTNLYNFMDGVDGIAGIQAVVAGAVLALWFAWQGADALAVLSLAFAAAAAGFLVWNRAPATVFMGDAGSTSLGLFFALAFLIGIVHYDFSVLASLILLAAFWGDATLTLVRRVVRGAPFWRPHREHYYQRAVQAGLSHRRVAAHSLWVSVVLGGLATAEFLRIAPRFLWSALAVGLLAMIVFAVHRREAGAG